MPKAKGKCYLNKYQAQILEEFILQAKKRGYADKILDIMDVPNASLDRAYHTLKNCTS